MRIARCLFVTTLAMSAISALCSEATAQSQKQPVFLLCLHRTNYSSWSLYLEVDPKDPSKVLRLGLEELLGQNSKDSTYEKVLAAQKDAKTKRSQVAVLEAADFGKKELRVADHDALHVGLKRSDNGAYHLALSLRVGASDRFVIGGKNSKKNDISLCYDAKTQTWSAKANALANAEGAALIKSKGISISGLLFPLTDTGIYSMLGVVNGTEVVNLMDRGGLPE